jgi:Flp pilus assembly protein TadD
MTKRQHVIEAHYQQAARLLAAGQREQATLIYHEILAAEPRHAHSLLMLGVLALQSGQPEHALRQFDAAIAVRPRAALFHVNRASALHRLGRLAEAAEACAAALRIDRACAEAHQMLGHVHADQGDPVGAVEAYRAAARIRPALFDIYNNLGVALRQAGRLEEAERALREALRREPAEPGITANLCGVLKELGRLGEAENGLRTLLRADPANAAVRYNLGLLLLLRGQFEEGWACYEARAAAGAVSFPAFRQPRWQGEALADRSLLVHAEQGLGATIQFARFLPLLAARNPRARIVFQVPAALRRLLSSLEGSPIILSEGKPLPSIDVVCALQSLPLLLTTRADTVPRDVPYLSPDPERVSLWRARIGPHDLRVGIAWQGNPASQAELGRSVPLAAFGPLAGMPGVRLISLQKHAGLEQLTALPPGFAVETLGEEFDSGPDGFVDTAAVMQSLDLVVASDSAVAHLAGALGRPVWLALQHVPDWRWMLERTDSPWYPTMHLYRQTTRGDWAGVFGRIATDLAGLAKTRGDTGRIAG